MTAFTPTRSPRRGQARHWAIWANRRARRKGGTPSPAWPPPGDVGIRHYDTRRTMARRLRNRWAMRYAAAPRATPIRSPQCRTIAPRARSAGEEPGLRPSLPLPHLRLHRRRHDPFPGGTATSAWPSTASTCLHSSSCAERQARRCLQEGSFRRGMAGCAKVLSRHARRGGNPRLGHGAQSRRARALLLEDGTTGRSS
jgi:hypothetical protein